MSFVAAYTLLCMNSDLGAQKVTDAFKQANGKQLDGICEALCHGPIDKVLNSLERALASARPRTALAATEVLTFHSRFDRPNMERLAEFMRDENPEVRRSAWRSLVVLDSVSKAQLAPVLDFSSLYEAALHAEDPGVRREALWAAAWTHQRWLMEHCRKLSDDPLPEHLDAIVLLAILSDPSELDRIMAAGKAAELGPQRLQVLGAFGHPGVVDTVLEGILSEDPLAAVAAGSAFTKITGADIESDKRVQVQPEDGSEPDEFELEFLDEVTLPSPELAQAHWDKVKSEFSDGTRWCRGFDLSQGATDKVLAQLDLESRWEACLRGKFESTWDGSLIDLEAFPQKSVKRWSDFITS